MLQGRLHPLLVRVVLETITVHGRALRGCQVDPTAKLAHVASTAGHLRKGAVRAVRVENMRLLGDINRGACRCRLVLDWKCTPSVYKHEKESDLHQSIYPEGFYDVKALLLQCYHAPIR